MPFFSISSPSSGNATQLQGRNVSATAPATGAGLFWNGTAWAPGNGTTGPTGAPGQDGAKFYSGSSGPTGTFGASGDFWLDVNGGVLYGPKASGSWGAGIQLQGGPQGPTGAQSTVPGPTGPTGISNVTGPSGVTGGDAPGRRRGTAVGLWRKRRLVHRHGGRGLLRAKVWRHLGHADDRPAGDHGADGGRVERDRADWACVERRWAHGNHWPCQHCYRSNRIHWIKRTNWGNWTTVYGHWANWRYWLYGSDWSDRRAAHER